MANPSNALGQICASPAYLNNTYNIINVNTSKCFNRSNTTSNTSCDFAWYSMSPNITAIAPGSTNANVDIWSYHPTDQIMINLPIIKPLTVECPIPACGFAISGWYADLQRYLTYVNLLFAIVAVPMPMLRGFAQLYLFTVGLACLVHLVSIHVLTTRNTSKFLDMDFVPAFLYALAAPTATMLWSLLLGPRQSHSYIQGLWFQGLPAIYAFIIFVALVVFSALYRREMMMVSAVLLESETEFRLTSVCYLDAMGKFRPWTGILDYPIRQPDELMMFFLPAASETLASLVAVSKRALYPMLPQQLAIAIGAVIALWALIPFVGVTCCKTGNLDKVYLSVCALGLFVVFFTMLVMVEVAIHSRHIPRAEQPRQFSQWGPYVVTTVIIVGTIFAKLVGADKQTNNDPEAYKMGKMRVKNGVKANRRMRGQTL